jgi:hypothetical protein
MKYRNHVIVLGVAAAAFAAGRWAPTLETAAQAQPDKHQPAAGQPAMTPEQMKQMQDMEAKMKPGAEHKVLDVLVGDWKGSVTFWMSAGAPPMENKGSIHREWILDGHFVSEEVTGEPMGPGASEFQGHGIVGYNTIEKRYESGWIENMATWISTANGTYDAGKKTFSFSGDMLNPATGKREKTRSVLDCSSPDREVMTSWSIGGDGKEYKSFEGKFERVK